LYFAKKRINLLDIYHGGSPESTCDFSRRGKQKPERIHIHRQVSLLQQDAADEHQNSQNDEQPALKNVEFPSGRLHSFGFHSVQDIHHACEDIDDGIEAALWESPRAEASSSAYTVPNAGIIPITRNTAIRMLNTLLRKPFIIAPPYFYNILFYYVTAEGGFHRGDNEKSRQWSRPFFVTFSL